ncbi:MAG: endonuclease III [Clostridia bacterium]|nr:endonuclease III [Clostridia bacterium]
MKVKNRDELIIQLNKVYEDAECELNFNSTFELLVAVILSAQCTDKRVNIVTSELFKKYNTPKDFANMAQSELEGYIHSCGFFRNKAKNIISCAKDIVVRFGGVVPSGKAELKSLAGVGEKTANVVLATAFKTPAIAVDTHVFRVSRRLGIARGKNPKQVQESLEKNVDRALWSKTHYALVLHGRYVCKARKPECEKCEFNNLCEYYNKKVR